MDNPGWCGSPDVLGVSPDVNDVDVILQILGEQEAGRQSYEPYTPPHSDDACSPSTSNFPISPVGPVDVHPSRRPSHSGERWTSKKRRRVSPPPDYPRGLSVHSAASDDLDRIAVIEAELRAYPVKPDTVKEEPLSPNRDDRSDDSTSLKWFPYPLDQACCLCNERLQTIPTPQLLVIADKGFHYSPMDESFVNHRKNHVQISLKVQFSSKPSHILLPGGYKRLDGLGAHIYGLKVDSVHQRVMIEQSQSDRKKNPYEPVRLKSAEDGSITTTISRLHFSETTQNNQRKRGLPNPEQKYFKLVLALFAISGDETFPLTGSISERIIVRASNPKQFESDTSELQWVPGTTPASLCHKGRVGVNTTSPEEALTVHGNMKVSGQILQPSDKRVKEDISEMNYSEQLKKMSGIRLHQYHYNDAYSKTVDLPEKQRIEVGVIAQEIRELLPDAVVDVGDLKLSTGETINNLLVVNKDRIFLESVGAVKELCKLTGNMENRLCDLEHRDRKMAKLAKKLGGSLSSRSSSSSKSSGISKASVACVEAESKSVPVVEQPANCCLMYRVRQQVEMRSRRTIIGLLVLVFLLAMICVAAITAAVLYSERSRTNEPAMSKMSESSELSDEDYPIREEVSVSTTAASIRMHGMVAEESSGSRSYTSVLVNCTMTRCHNDGCCLKQIKSKTTPWPTPDPRQDLKIETTTAANKYQAKIPAAMAPVPNHPPVESSIDDANPDDDPKRKPVLVNTEMMADGGMIVKDDLKMRRRKRNSDVYLRLEEDCIVTSMTSKSVVYICPATGMDDRQTLTVSSRSQCKIANVTCACECLWDGNPLPPGSNCYASQLRITVSGTNCQPA